jgi:branched-chain amino acid transport system ATP-binding protein
MRGLFVRTERWALDGLWNGRRTRRAQAAAREEALSILEELGLTAFRQELASNLSYGHQKRLGVAIGIATRPKLLLMDEPVAGLNPGECADFAACTRSAGCRFCSSSTTCRS